MILEIHLKPNRSEARREKNKYDLYTWVTLTFISIISFPEQIPMGQNQHWIYKLQAFIYNA